MEGFQIFRSDRQEGIRKGGVLTFLREDVAKLATILDKGSENLIEFLAIWVEK